MNTGNVQRAASTLATKWLINEHGTEYSKLYATVHGYIQVAIKKLEKK